MINNTEFAVRRSDFHSVEELPAILEKKFGSRLSAIVAPAGAPGLIQTLRKGKKENS